MNWSEIVLAVIGVVSSSLGTGVLIKYLEWRSKRRQQEADIEKAERGDITTQWNNAIGDLRKELHTEKDERNAERLRYEDKIETRRLQHESAIEEIGQLKAVIHELEQKVGSLTAAGDIALVSVASDGKVVAWSPSATDLFGYSPLEALGKLLEELVIPEESQGLHKAALKRCADENRPPRSQSLILTARNKWGHKFLVEVSIRGTKDEGGHWSYTGTIRRRAERFN